MNCKSPNSPRSWTATLELLDRAPDAALLTLAEVSAITSRSRVSLYRDNRAGRLGFRWPCPLPGQ